MKSRCKGLRLFLSILIFTMIPFVFSCGVTEPGPRGLPTITILVPANNANFARGVAIVFVGAAVNADGDSLTGTLLVWQSSLDGTIGTGTTFTIDSLTVGIHVITLTATDSVDSNLTNSASVSITIVVSASSLTDDGWDRFEAADYDSAKTLFGEAIDLDSNFADAYNGRGWSCAFLGDLDGAEQNFSTAIALGLNAVDALVGRASVSLNLPIPRFPAAVIDAEAAIARDSDYVFQHKSSIDYRDIYLIIAQGYFGQGSTFFSQAQTAVNFLDPTNGLDPNNPNSWVVGGVQFNSYPEALLEKIEELIRMFAG